MIRRRTRDIEIRFVIPLPRRWWRRKRVSETTRRKISRSLRARHDRERGQMRIEEPAS